MSRYHPAPHYPRHHHDHHHHGQQHHPDDHHQDGTELFAGLCKDENPRGAA